jgi:8-oxo-dGTP pyrophosphatase MutT (NUDIX family)
MPEIENLKLSATIIVISKDNKALIVQRPADKAFPNLWTVAGGKLQDTDGIEQEKNFLYYSVELCAVRELFEETGISVDYKLLEYLCSITTIWSDLKRVIISYYVVLPLNAKDISITLSENQAYRWIPEYLIDSYNFIPDIGGEIKEVFKILRRRKS